MKYTTIFLLSTSVLFSQTPSKPAIPSPAPGRSMQSNPPARTGSSATATQQGSPAKKTASEMPMLHAVVKPLFSERYADIKIGTGAPVEPNKLYHVLYSGYLASTGQKFDSSADHPSPVMKDGKPVMGADGKPEMGPPQPLVFPQGMGRLIPGFDQGFGGMRVGGKRRIFIPWQLAYGTREMPASGGHIGIPSKSDLIFDVELVEMTDLPAQPQMPPRPNMPPPTPQHSAPPPGSPPPPSAAPAGSAPPPPAASAPAAPTGPPQPK